MFFSEYIGFPLSTSFNRCWTLILQTNHKDKLEKPASLQTKDGISDRHLTENYLHVVLLTVPGRAMTVTRHFMSVALDRYSVD